MVLLEEEPPFWDWSSKMDLRDMSSSRSSTSDSESVIGVGNSGGAGGAVALLSLRLLRKQGPTLPSRLAGAAEDCLRLLVSVLEARLDSLRIKLVLLLEATGVVSAGAVVQTLLLRDSGLIASAMGLVLLIQLLPSELVLLLRVRMDSGNWKLLEN